MNMNVKKHTLILLLMLGISVSLCAGTSNVPRKQLFDFNWRFHIGDVNDAEQTAFQDHNWTTVNLPHDWSIAMKVDANAPAGNDGGYYPTGIGWYRKTFDLTKAYQGKMLWLYFEGIYQDSKVYVNGKLAGGHPYGFSSFYCDITSLVQTGKNVVAVRADNSRQKNCRWYTGSGIYRHAWLMAAEPVHIDNWGVHITTLDLNTVKVKTLVSNTLGEQQTILLTTTLSDGTSQHTPLTIPANSKQEVEQTIAVKDAKLWSPEHPNLYQAHIELSTGDAVDKTFGIRTVDFSAEKGLLLNGNPILLNGGCVHHDNGILGAATFDRAETRRVELMKEAGYNAVRTSHNPPSEAFLDACDRLGLLVIDEAFDGWRDAKNDQDYHTLFDKWFAKDIEAMVRRDRNHPSIFCWSIGNEVIERKKIEVVTTARRLREAVHAWDKTRPITSALAAWDSDWEIYDPLVAQLDITGYNYIIHKAPSDHLRVPNRVMMQTESYPNDAFKSWAMVHDNPYVVGDFVWTSIDYLGESGIGRWWYEDDVPGEHYERPLYPWHASYCGDIDFIGWLKPIGHYRNMLWNNDEKLYMAVREPNDWQGNGTITTGRWAVWPTWESWNWPGWEGKDIEVVVCSKYPRVRLYLNDQLIGEQNTGRDTEFKAVFKTPYRAGQLRAEGLDGETVMERQLLVSASAAKSIKLTADRSRILADGQDLSFITVEVVDAEGRLDPNASYDISFSLKGNGTIVAVGNADIKETTPYSSHTFKTWKGRAMMVVRSTRKAGNLQLTATANNLKRAKILLKSVKAIP
ncbi:glycosyl hydrolase family 2, sugar binding domain protein [Hallella bergensis DSM 17361]|uniref:Glycosyl hydrolase family 2, sugar binding domain protein n=1 Tax=Hallella bergensis DSM 17361 TaxID=585502 RepID=D1PZT8_9BACT|nr:glycosyl hydrolase family 2, sugar binding domain protein [Hallella bergensis DSM 17361]